ncbi:MAG TPA: Mov34/MPN/PAD-1 family protein [Tepidisphaeraceae bacterium]|nr:Mov34/MPN/PAD-1 family protein [Tepidisphaeraceae bacterium]
MPGGIGIGTVAVRRLVATDRPRRPTFEVVLERSAIDDIHAHGAARTDIEVCGVMVGNVYRDELGPYLYVEAVIRGNAAAGRSTQVTFTDETWTTIHAELERAHAGRRIVGWYHTHPGFGVFLSDMDLFIQDNFFNLSWQVAFVHDPVRHEDGLFVWRGGQSVPEPFLIEGTPVAAPAAAPGSAGRQPGRVRTWFDRWRRGGEA